MSHLSLFLKQFIHLRTTLFGSDLGHPASDSNLQGTVTLHTQIQVELCIQPELFIST